MNQKRILHHSQDILWTIECNRVMWYSECKRLPWIWNLRSRCSAGAWSCENVPPGADRKGRHWPALSCKYRAVRHNTERAGCDAAHPHLQAARRTLLQPGAASGGQWAAPADKPQITALPGEVSAHCVRCHWRSHQIERCGWWEGGCVSVLFSHLKKYRPKGQKYRVRETGKQCLC